MNSRKEQEEEEMTRLYDPLLILSPHHPPISYLFVASKKSSRQCEKMPEWSNWKHPEHSDIEHWHQEDYLSEHRDDSFPEIQLLMRRLHIMIHWSGGSLVPRMRNAGWPLRSVKSDCNLYTPDTKMTSPDDSSWLSTPHSSEKHYLTLNWGRGADHQSINSASIIKSRVRRQLFGTDGWTPSSPDANSCDSTPIAVGMFSDTDVKSECFIRFMENQRVFPDLLSFCPERNSDWRGWRWDERESRNAWSYSICEGNHSDPSITMIADPHKISLKQNETFRPFLTDDHETRKNSIQSQVTESNQAVRQTDIWLWQLVGILQSTHRVSLTPHLWV